MDEAADFREVAARFTALVDGVPDDATWSRPAPVEGWRARDVVGHLVTWFPALLEGGAGVVLSTGPDVEDDPAGAWHATRDAVAALLDDPASSTRLLRNPHIGELPLPVVVARFFTPDVFMHSWDLARATGQDETLDPRRCADLLEGMRPIEALLRDSGQYGPEVKVGDDADVASRFLGFIGRDPR